MVRLEGDSGTTERDDVPVLVGGPLPSAASPSATGASTQSPTEKARLVAGRLWSLYQDQPLGTKLVTFLVYTFTAIEILFFSGKRPLLNALSLSPDDVFSHPLTLLWRLFLYPLVFFGPWHWIVGILLFPLGASRREREIGTLQFLFLFLLLNAATGLFYIFPTYILSFFVNEWSKSAIVGLDIPFMAFLTVEAMALQPTQMIPRFACVTWVQLLS